MTPPRPDAMRAAAFGVRVYYEDTDAAGIVYHAGYLRFAERARTELLRGLGFGQERLMREGGLAFAVRRLAIDYLRPARLDDELVVVSRLVRVGAVSLDLEQTVRRAHEDLARLTVQVAALALASGRPARLPSALRDALAPLELGLNSTTLAQ